MPLSLKSHRISVLEAISIMSAVVVDHRCFFELANRYSWKINFCR